VSNQEHRPLRAVPYGTTETDELPRPAVHSPKCLCGCALATYATAEPPARELRERAA
jgi:hypothetical protein